MDGKSRDVDCTEQELLFNAQHIIEQRQPFVLIYVDKLKDGGQSASMGRMRYPGEGTDEEKNLASSHLAKAIMCSFFDRKLVPDKIRIMTLLEKMADINGPPAAPKEGE